MSYSINFYLDRSISEKNQQHILVSGDVIAKRKLKETIETVHLQIFLYLRFEGRTIKVYTERKCTQRQWDVQSQRVNPRFFKDGAIELNNYFNKLKSHTAKLFEEHNHLGVVTTKEDVLGVIDACNNREILRNAPVSFEEAFAEFITFKKAVHAENTLKKYRTTIKHLKGFAEKKRVTLRFENITLLFERRFRDYLLHECGLTNNSIAKYIKTLKTFMNFCTEDRKYNSPHNIEYRKFVTSEQEKEVHVLSVAELLHLYHYSFENGHFAHVRDVFCFLCFTGLRFSDVEKLKRGDIRNGALHVLVKKTKQYIAIPLNQYAKAILEKYQDHERPLPVISNQKTNQALHEIGKLVGFNELVKVVTYKGTEVYEEYVPKYEVLTTHIGRKTFITTSLILGIPERALQAMGAPKHHSVFRRYIGFADTYKQQAMDNAWNPDKLGTVKS